MQGAPEGPSLGQTRGDVGRAVGAPKAGLSLPAKAACVSPEAVARFVEVTAPLDLSGGPGKGLSQQFALRAAAVWCECSECGRAREDRPCEDKGGISRCEDRTPAFSPSCACRAPSTQAQGWARPVTARKGRAVAGSPWPGPVFSPSLPVPSPFVLTLHASNSCPTFFEVAHLARVSSRHTSKLW